MELCLLSFGLLPFWESQVLLQEFSVSLVCGLGGGVLTPRRVPHPPEPPPPASIWHFPHRGGAVVCVWSRATPGRVVREEWELCANSLKIELWLQGDQTTQNLTIFETNHRTSLNMRILV